MHTHTLRPAVSPATLSITPRSASEYAAVAAQLASCQPYPRALKARSVAAPHRADAPMRASVPQTRRP